jgi:hypothetical protein
MPKNDGTPTMYERVKARDMAELNDATLTLHDAAIARDKAATKAREANERQQAARRVTVQERARAHAILSHPAVVSGRARQLAHFLLFETDMSVADAHAALNQAHAGDPEKVHPSGGYEAGRASAERLLHPSEVNRRRLQKINDDAFAEANFGMVSVDRRSDRDKEKDEQFADIARGCRNRDDTASPNKPDSRKSDESDDDADLKAMGFGSPVLMDHGLYDAGAASASRILGKSAPSRGGDAPSSVGRQAAARVVAPTDDLYSEGRASALKLLGTGAIKAEIDSDLKQRFAMQQARRAQE